MMCNQCCDAGLMLTTMGSFISREDLTVLHDRCEYPVSCTCQHQAVSALNLTRIDGWAGEGFTRKYEDEDE